LRLLLSATTSFFLGLTASFVFDENFLFKGIADANVAGTSETLDGVLVLTDESVDSGRIPYLGVNVGSMGDMNKLESELQTALRLERLRRAGVDPFVAMPALRSIQRTTSFVCPNRIFLSSSLRVAAGFGLISLASA